MKVNTSGHSTQFDHISVSLSFSEAHKWYSIIKPEVRGPNDSSDFSHSFCISSQAQLGTMSPNPTHTSPKHVRQGITTIQLWRYSQISLCDWILCTERSLWVGCEEEGCAAYMCVCSGLCLRQLLDTHTVCAQYACLKVQAVQRVPRREVEAQRSTVQIWLQREADGTSSPEALT